MTSLQSTAALEAAVTSVRAVQVKAGDVARLTICDDGNDGTVGFAANEDPVVRFSFAEDSDSTAAFRVGFRTAGLADWSAGCWVSITRDGSVAPAAAVAGTYTGDLEVVRGGGRVYITFTATNLETINGAIELSVDTEAGPGVTLSDFRYDVA